MAICVVVLSESIAANQLLEKLKTSSVPLRKCQLVKPCSAKVESTIKTLDKNQQPSYNLLEELKPIDINAVKLLTPKLSRKLRQRSMALWLIPFGFFAGFTFAGMTGLKTFSEIGFPSWSENIISSLLGMGAGWIGSYFASISVNSDNGEDIRTLREFSSNGNWLLLLETPLEVELPWQLVKEINPIEIVRLSEF